MNEIEISEQRSTLYWWFSTLLTKELEKEQLAQYFSGDGLAFLSQLEEDPLFSGAVLEIKSALLIIMAIKHPTLELAADFSQLFLTDAKKGAPPYASVYLSSTGQLFEKPHHDMLELFEKEGLIIDPNFKEPADHIAVQLDYMGNLIVKEGENTTNAQKEFVNDHLINWLPQFIEATKKVKNSGFYQGVCKLLLVFITNDLEEIK